MSERGAQYTFRHLTEQREIDVEDNVEGRVVTLADGRQFMPKWFIHVRCVCAWAQYQSDRDRDGSEKPAPFAGFKIGRPRRKPANRADSEAENPQTVRSKPANGAEKPANGAALYKERSLKESVVEERVPLPRNLAFKGTRLRVPKFLHQEFADQLGAGGQMYFDLMEWYQDLDRSVLTPIIGDLCAFIRQEFDKECKRRFKGDHRRLPPASAYEWNCSHTPRCPHRAACVIVEHRKATA
jgi:hypothetical protein